MADYEPVTRSNCFKVKDAETFQKDIIDQKIQGITFNANENEERLFVGHKDNEITMCGYCSIPNWHYSEKAKEDIEFDFPKFIAKRIAPGSTCNLMEIGHTKLRSIHAVHYKITSEEIKETFLGISE
jgi:hypothetical protein